MKWSKFGHEEIFIKDNQIEYQTIKEDGKTKFVVLPIKLFEAILDRLDDESDLLSIRAANKEPLDNGESRVYI